ncbi:hypothetical protein JTE90_023290 [Oedothorax gibbosus]|uniref:RING-type domain-containing protein n=1 Tax=Oedothorax gibbosus TaxID=931172 RepID=A0AAV6UPP7_9ARAC|nr:hypothetical protein JTE90_023290 [Oedothorax gibbosus]
MSMGGLFLNKTRIMEEDQRPQRPNRSRIPWSLQQLHQNSHEIASSASHHIHEIQDYLLQGLTPLISAPSAQIPSSPRNEPVLVPPPARVPVAPHENFIIDIEALEEQHRNAANEANAENGDGENGNPSLRNQPELQAAIAFAEKYVPFVLILVLKLVFDHRIGILVNLGLFITFCHANTVIKREVAKQGKWRVKNLFLVCLNLVLSISVIYTLLADHNLAYALVFIPPYSSPIDFWEVLWIVSVTDFVLRLFTILVKVIFVALPARLIAFPRKGKYYLFTERSSQLYRTVIPMQHWLYFFSESYSGPSKVFGVILSAAYLIFKVKSIIKKAKLWKKTLIKVLQSKTYGVTPSTNQIKEAGDACPICQDDYKSPAMLQCKHIFCEECVALWFDRERTCPICRAQIADDPSWRDGSTTLLHQIF